MRFVKMQGTGNDFLLVEAKDEQRDWGALARAMCDRHYGAGADGLMLVLPSQGADVRMRLFNADGSEAEVSGNGVRCLVKYAVEGGLARPRDGRLRVEVASGVREAEVISDGKQVEQVRLSMGAPRFAAKEACLKAFGVGMGGFGATGRFQEIEVETKLGPTGGTVIILRVEESPVVVRISYQKTKTVKPKDIERELRAGPAKLVAIVHAETSTGVRQPVEPIAKLAKEAGALLLLDCVTSLGGVPVEIFPFESAAAGGGIDSGKSS